MPKKYLFNQKTFNNQLILVDKQLCANRMTYASCFLLQNVLFFYKMK